MSDEELRREAVESLKRKRGFLNFAISYAVVNIVVVAIWAIADRGYFWPAWVLLGTTIGLIFSWWNTYGGGNRPITDEAVQEEIKRLRGK